MSADFSFEKGEVYGFIAIEETEEKVTMILATVGARLSEPSM